MTRITGGASSSLPSGFLIEHRDVGLHAAQLRQEVDVEIGAAELAVGDAVQAHVFLELDDVGDGAVFHRAQLLGRDLALGVLLARVEQELGAQEAADVVGTEGGLGGCGHGGSGWDAPFSEYSNVQ